MNNKLGVTTVNKNTIVYEVKESVLLLAIKSEIRREYRKNGYDYVRMHEDVLRTVLEAIGVLKYKPLSENYEDNVTKVIDLEKAPVVDKKVFKLLPKDYYGLVHSSREYELLYILLTIAGANPEELLKLFMDKQSDIMYELSDYDVQPLLLRLEIPSNVLGCIPGDVIKIRNMGLKKVERLRPPKYLKYTPVNSLYNAKDVFGIIDSIDCGGRLMSVVNYNSLVTKISELIENSELELKPCEVSLKDLNVIPNTSQSVDTDYKADEDKEKLIVLSDLNNDIKPIPNTVNDLLEFITSSRETMYEVSYLEKETPYVYALIELLEKITSDTISEYETENHQDQYIVEPYTVKEVSLTNSTVSKKDLDEFLDEIKTILEYSNVDPTWLVASYSCIFKKKDLEQLVNELPKYEELVKKLYWRNVSADNYFSNNPHKYAIYQAAKTGLTAKELATNLHTYVADFKRNKERIENYIEDIRKRSSIGLHSFALSHEELDFYVMDMEEDIINVFFKGLEKAVYAHYLNEELDGVTFLREDNELRYVSVDLLNTDDDTLVMYVVLKRDKLSTVNFKNMTREFIEFRNAECYLVANSNLFFTKEVIETFISKEIIKSLYRALDNIQEMKRALFNQTINRD